MGALLWDVWLRIQLPVRYLVGERRDPDAVEHLRVACPHCTNNDTLSLHCPDDRCGWVRCTCGALIYSRRRHRHPRHHSDADTCHDPRAAV